MARPYWSGSQDSSEDVEWSEPDEPELEDDDLDDDDDDDDTMTMMMMMMMRAMTKKMRVTKKTSN